MTNPDLPRAQSSFLSKWGRLIAVAAAVVIAFLLGFIPEYLRASKLSDDLNGVRQERHNLLARQSSLQLRGQIDQVYIQATRKNYGVASGEASAFFDHVRAAMGDSSDAGLNQTLQKISERRDVVISGLAKADPSVVTSIDEIVDEMTQQVPLAEQ